MIGRLQKIMAAQGIASRRKCEELITQGRVMVNGRKAVIGQSADSDKDDILVDGRKFYLQKKVYLMLNKPVDFVTSVADPLHATIMELVKIGTKIFPVGRLDKDAEGLVLLTNDGELANRVMHPRYETQKEYVATLNKKFIHLEQLMRGVRVMHRKVRPSLVRKLDPKKVAITIHEGRKHVVKLIFKTLGYRIERLVRTKMSSLELGKLKSGSWRYLNEQEIELLKKSANLA